MYLEQVIPPLWASVFSFVKGIAYYLPFVNGICDCSMK